MVSAASKALACVRGFYLELADVFYSDWRCAMETPQRDLGRVMSVYSLFDRKLREYGALVLERNDEAIVRSLIDGVRGSGSLMEKHPEDFDLMHIGSYNTASGQLGSQAELFAPRLVANLGELLKVMEVPSAASEA